MDGLDLREHQDSEEIKEAFSKLVSGGKPGYKTIITKDKKPIYCKSCNHLLKEEDKFCSNCGEKVQEN